MKIAFLHLSDIHFVDSDRQGLHRIDKIVSALRVLQPFSELFIIFTGDLAYSGIENQYKNASDFFEKLCYTCMTTFNLAHLPYIQMVPGNHDVLLAGNDDDFLLEVNQSYKDDTIDELFIKEIDKQAIYYRTARRFGCSSLKKEVVLRKKYNAADVSIEFVLINTAPFSMRNQEKGLHYLSESCLEEACRESDADYVFYIMHHAYHWFNDIQKSMLENAISQQGNVLFVGHEHNAGNQDILHNHNTSTFVSAGGMLANKGDWEHSEFSAYSFNVDVLTNNWVGYSFTWNPLKNIYVENSIGPKTLLARKDDITGLLNVKPEYMAQVLFDEKMPGSVNLDQYFVFPRLELQRISEHSYSGDCSTYQAFLEMLENDRRIVIYGPSGSGKTTLLRYLFYQLMQEKTVLFFQCDDITSGNSERIIRHKVSDMFGDSREHHSAFLQLPMDQKVIIIDDSNMISERHRTQFLSEIEDKFGYVIISRNEYMNFDVEERLKMDAMGNYARYSISSFYIDKRNQLISKLVPLFSDVSDTHGEIINTICDALRKQRTISYYTAEIICQFVQLYCKNIVEARQNDGGIWNKVFEANLIKQIEPYATHMTVDLLFIILDRIAYCIHSKKLYPIPEASLIGEIEAYKQDYGSIVSTQDVLTAIVDSNLMRHDAHNNTYHFTNKSHLIFFVAREIRRRYIHSRDTTDLKNSLTYCCFGINADILMMLTYITEDEQMLNTLLEIALQYINDWEEVSLDPVNIPLLAAGNSPSFARPSGDTPKAHEQRTLSQEKQNAHAAVASALNIYDFDELDAETLGNQLSRAISLLVAVARCLPSFEHMMRSDVKKRFVAAIYELPQKIFYKWAIQVDRKKGELIDELYCLLSEASANNKNVRVLTKDEIAQRFQRDALCQYLNILYIAIVYSTRENTLAYLNEYDYKAKSPGRIMHAMMLERQERIDTLYDEGVELFEISKSNPVVRYLLQYVMYHSVIFSEKITQAQMQRIEDISGRWQRASSTSGD